MPLLWRDAEREAAQHRSPEPACRQKGDAPRRQAIGHRGLITHDQHFGYNVINRLHGCSCDLGLRRHWHNFRHPNHSWHCKLRRRETPALVGLEVTAQPGKAEASGGALRRNSHPEKPEGSEFPGGEGGLQKVSGRVQGRADCCPRQKVIAQVGLTPPAGDGRPSQCHLSP